MQAKPPSVCNPKIAKAVSHLLSSRFLLTSAEKAENVVKQPRKPVTKQSLVCSDNEIPIVSPIKKQPSQLISNVPNAKEPNNGLSQSPISQRVNPPTIAPIEIKRKVAIFTPKITACSLNL